MQHEIEIDRLSGGLPSRISTVHLMFNGRVILARINELLDADAAQWWAERDQRDVMEKLVEHYRVFALKIAQPLFRKIGHRSLDWDEVSSAALFGLCQAIQRFEPGHHAKFTSFATWRIRGAIFDAAREHDWVPHIVRKNEKMGMEVIPSLFRIDESIDRLAVRERKLIFDLECPSIPDRYHRCIKNILQLGIKKAAAIEFASVGQLQAVLGRPLIDAIKQQA
ncbi:sigma-70 family RNA polymerase sigma factor [Planctomicrobium sp. SH668]|uniref:sigma-70 family RNA polymerase sigma factor n=1 Tax=Planctomicrobium sp. SH668 TaxID=3448126 RepID=UPI003F5C678D